MKEIIALQEYTDKYVSLYEGEIRNIQDRLAEKLIEQGIVAEHSDDSEDGGKTSSGPFLVNFTAEMTGQTNVKFVATLVDDVSLKEITDHIAAGDILFVVKPLWPFPTPVEDAYYFRPDVIEYMPDGGNVSSFWCAITHINIAGAIKEIHEFQFCYENETYTFQHLVISISSN